jgi:molybdopterin converting factor small subunit
MIEVRLFGNLRHHAADSAAGPETVLYLPVDKSETLGQALAQIGIHLDEVGNLFLNGRLLPRSRYPILLGYPLAAESPLSQDRCLDTPLKAGDRLGIFPRNMGVVVV